MIEKLVALFPALASLPAGAYVVGGAVRDLLRGHDPSDVDVACSDPLAAARAVRDRVIPLGGAGHLRAYRVIDEGRIYDFAEIAGGEILRDLGRRDLTIDAMALDPRTDEVLDPFEGRDDLAAHRVRMVAPDNFSDDPLRIVKAIRMAVTLGFEIEPATMDAMKARTAMIARVAPERVTHELSLMLSARRFRRAVHLLHESGVDEVLALRTGEFRADDLSLAAALALLVMPPDAERIPAGNFTATYAETWRWSDSLRHAVMTLQALREHSDLASLYDAGRELVMQLPPMLQAAGDAPLGHINDAMFDVVPLLDGHEIAELTGIPAGAEIGRMKRALLERQLRGEILSREEAIRFVQQKP